MSKRRDLGNEDIRYRVLRMLEAEPDLSQRQIADRLGISLGSVNYCIHAFVQAGLLRLSNFQKADDKRRYAYLLTPTGIMERARMTRAFFARKLHEHAELTAEIEAIRQELAAHGPIRTDELPPLS